MSYIKKTPNKFDAKGYIIKHAVSIKGAFLGLSPHLAPKCQSAKASGIYLFTIFPFTIIN